MLRVVGDHGVTALARTLKSNAALTTLDLWFNSIGDVGASALAEALKSNSALATLDLDVRSIPALVAPLERLRDGLLLVAGTGAATRVAGVHPSRGWVWAPDRCGATRLRGLDILTQNFLPHQIVLLLQKA